MEITLSTVLHIAELSKLKFSEEETQKFTAELGKIIEYINKLHKLNIASDISCLTTTHNLRLRDDEIVKGLSTSEALSGAPSTSKNYLVVPKLI